MNDTTSAAPSDAEIDAQWRESVAKHETTAAFVRAFARAVLAKWGAPQPVAREPMTDEQCDAAAKKLAECMDYPWEHMPEQGRKHMREYARSVVAAAIGISEGDSHA